MLLLGGVRHTVGVQPLNFLIQLSGRITLSLVSSAAVLGSLLSILGQLLLCFFWEVIEAKLTAIKIKLCVIDSNTSQAGLNLWQQLTVLRVLEPWFICAFVLATGIHSLYRLLGVDFVQHNLVNQTTLFVVPPFVLEILAGAGNSITSIGIFWREERVLHYRLHCFGFAFESISFLDIVDLVVDHLQWGERTFEQTFFFLLVVIRFNQ